MLGLQSAPAFLQCLEGPGFRLGGRARKLCTVRVEGQVWVTVARGAGVCRHLTGMALGTSCDPGPEEVAFLQLYPPMAPGLWPLEAEAVGLGLPQWVPG